MPLSAYNNNVKQMQTLVSNGSDLEEMLAKMYNSFMQKSKIFQIPPDQITTYKAKMQNNPNQLPAALHTKNH